MRSYTDIEQSRKLAEILPLESADMYYYSYMSLDKPFYMNYPDVIEEGQKLAKNDIPCWSFMALIRIIPKHIRKYNILRIDINDRDFAIWYDKLSYGVNTNLPDITSESPIDACYEVILKLHEKKLLKKEETKDQN